MNKPHKSVLSTLPLAAIGISAIFGLRNLPITAQYGLSSISIFLAAALLFFIPSAYVCSTFSKKIAASGGLYAWVKAILGEKLGFIAIWLEWINTTTSFPMMISFVIFTVLYAIDPAFASSHKVLEFFLYIIVFWGLTALNFFGIKLSSRIITICVFLGTLLPAALISILGFIWVLGGHPMAIQTHWQNLLPNFQFNSLTFLVAAMNSFSGIQIIAFHRADSQNPEKTLPRAILCSVIVILILSISSTLAVATIIPHHALMLIGGIIQAIQSLFTTFHIGFLIPVFTILIALGVLSEVTSWIIGPSKGISVAAETGFLPKKFKKRNRHGVPITVLVIQAIVSSILASVFTFMPTVSQAYWLLSDLTAQFTLLMWILVFFSALIFAIRLNNRLLMLAAIVGMISSFVIGILGYLPPQSVIDADKVIAYESFLIGGLLILIVAPLAGRLLYLKHKTKS